MKKTIIAILLVFVVAITLTGCNSNKNTNVKNDKTKSSEIVVEINSGIPYNWSYTIDDNSIIKFKNMEEEKPDTMGGSVEQHYIFEGIKEGKTTIKFELKSITDASVDQTKSYDAVVDKNLNVTITEKK